MITLAVVFIMPSPENSAAKTMISWEQAVQHIHTCNTASVMQTHAKEVSLLLKNGERITTQEPSIDDVFKEVDKSRSLCGTILVATE